MKKVLLLMILALTVFSVAGCVEIVSTTATTQMTTTTTAVGETTTTDALTGTTATTTRQLVYGTLPDDEVEISFWHTYGLNKSALLDAMIAEFQEMFPNVTVTSTAQTNYDMLLSKISTGISSDVIPTMAVSYPDHVATYIDANEAYALDNFINSNIIYEIEDSASSIFGETVTVGLDLEDFVPSYVEENNQYVGGLYYSVPFSKSTETMAVNADVLAAHAAEIRALGIDISDNGYVTNHDVPLTFTQILQLREILVDEAGANATTMKCEYLLNYDSSSNMFINFSRQFNAPYTNTQGYILIDNDVTLRMLNYIDSMFAINAYVLPIVWAQSYGSTNFIYGDVCMSSGSTAGVDYNIPAKNLPSDLSKLKFGVFDVDFMMLPQPTATNDTAVTLSVDGTDYSFTGSFSAVQQGPNIGIFKSASTNEKLYAWLLIKYLTSPVNTARWAMDTGYLPARVSSYTSETEIRMTGTFNVSYKDFLQIALDFWNSDGNPGWAVEDERWDFLHRSMVANIARFQNDYYRYDPGFADQTVDGMSGSAYARQRAGFCLEDIITGAYTPEQALDVMIGELVW